MELDPFGVASRFWLLVLFNREDGGSSFPLPVPNEAASNLQKKSNIYNSGLSKDASRTFGES